MAQLRDTTINGNTTISGDMLLDGALSVPNGDSRTDIISFVKGLMNPFHKYDYHTESGTNQFKNHRLTIHGSGWIYIAAYIWVDEYTDYGQCVIAVYNDKNNSCIIGSKDNYTNPYNYTMMSSVSLLYPVSDGDIYRISPTLTKRQSKEYKLNAWGFGCTFDLSYS